MNPSAQVMDRIGFFGTDSSRSRAYACALESSGLLPSQAVLLSPPNEAPGIFPPVPYFDNQTPLADRLARWKIPVQVVPESAVNDRQVIQAVAACDVDVLIYSGPGGAIVGPELLRAGKRWLHIHPGLVPEFRGSTTVYYSLLEQGKCGASAIFLAERIDAGEVLATREYPPPTERQWIDHGYDPYIRSDLLVSVLRDYRRHGTFHARPQTDDCDAEAYYVMHPILRHVAILSRRKAA